MKPRSKLRVTFESVKIDVIEKVRRRLYDFKIITSDVFSLPEIIARVIAHEDPPFRPVVRENACKAELQSLMTQCWDNDPDRRPHFNKILDKLRKVMGR